MNDSSKRSVTHQVLGHTMSRRGVLRSAGVAALIGAAASTTYVAPTVLGQTKAPVTFWTTHSDIGLEALKQIASDFNAQNDEHEVEVVQRPPADVSDSSSLITAVRGGEGPDVYLLDRFIVAERAAQGLLQNLTPFIEAAGENPDLTEKWVSFAAAEATYNNNAYALPFDTDVRALFFNKQLFADAGVDMSLLDSANGPMTYDQLAEIATALNQDDGSNFSQVGYIPYFGQAGSIYTDGFAWGGEFFDYENCVLTPDNDQVVAAATWGQDYVNNLGAEKLYAFAQNAMRDGAAPTDSPFIQKRLGAFITGNWEFANFRTYIPDVEVGYTFTPVPKEGDPSITWAGGWSGVVPEGAKNPEGGFAFVQYLTGPDGSRLYVQKNNNLPVLRELLSDPELFDENLQWFVDNLFPGTKNRPVLPVGARYWAELDSAWESIYLNQSEPRAALETAKRNTQADLDAGGYCPVAPPPEEPAAEASPAS